MRTLLFLVALAFLPAAHAQTPTPTPTPPSACGTNPALTLVKGQEFKQFTTVINQQTACIHELRASLLLSQKDIANIIAWADNKLRRELAIVCAYNAKVPGWLTALPGMEPLPTDDLACPPPGSKFYKIQYISKDAPADITPP